MPKAVDCPFYMYDKANYIKCEGENRIKKFKDRKALKKYRTDICGNVGTYMKCEIAKSIDKEWEDKLNGKCC
jgi:hypothetical protein